MFPWSVCVFLGVQRRRKVALKHNCESEEAIKAGPKLCITKFLYKEYSKDLCLCWKGVKTVKTQF
jgi:hypothetical protein